MKREIYKNSIKLSILASKNRKLMILTTVIAIFAIGLSYLNVSSTYKAHSKPLDATISPSNNLPVFYTPPSPLPYAPPGTLIRYESVTGISGVPSGSTLYRILYHSRSVTGADIADSGFVVVPGGTAPSGGFPVMTIAHGTTGVADICAPSLFSPAVGGSSISSPYLSDGFVVAATDYQGLGTPGLHQYLEGESEGRAVLDAARAARQLPGLITSSKLIILGHSQGGHAALFAGEIAPSYAPEFDVLGVVAEAPATNLSVIISVAPTPYLPSGARSFVMLAAWTWQSAYPNLPISDILTPTGQEVASKLVNNICDGSFDSDLANFSNSELFTPNVSSDPLVMDYARLNDPGRVKTLAPILVVQGTADTTVPKFLTDGYVTNFACPIGDTIDYLYYTGANHNTILSSAFADIQSWIAARLSGAAPPTTCGLPGDSAAGT